MTPCTICRTPCTTPVMFTIRGISGLRFTGRVVIRGSFVCDGCCEFFTTAVQG